VQKQLHRKRTKGSAQPQRPRRIGCYYCFLDYGAVLSSRFTTPCEHTILQQLPTFDGWLVAHSERGGVHRCPPGLRVDSRSCIITDFIVHAGRSVQVDEIWSEDVTASVANFALKPVSRFTLFALSKNVWACDTMVRSVADLLFSTIG
jgi:hypothetical protein